MKKVFAVALLALIATCFGKIQAQSRDCNAIVLPHVAYNQEVLDEMAPEKIDWYCRYSQSAFFFTNSVPSGAPVYQITDLKNNRTGNYVASDFKVDLNTLSFYAYNFNEYQYRHINDTVYYRLGSNNEARYLGVRTYLEMERIANNIQ